MKKHIVFLMSALIAIPVTEAGLLDNVVNVVNKVSEVTGATQGSGTTGSTDKRSNRRSNRNGTNSSSNTNTGTGIQNIVTSKDVNEDKPVGVSNRFSNDIVRIYLCFNYTSLTVGDTVKITWYSNNNGNLTKIYESQMTISQQSGFGESHIKLPVNTKWPVGAYRVDVMLNIGLAGSVNFEVYDPASSGTSTSTSSSNSSTASSSGSTSSDSGSLLDQILSLTKQSSGTGTSAQQNVSSQAVKNGQGNTSQNTQQQNWPGQVNSGTSQNPQAAQSQQNPGMHAVAPVSTGTQLYYGNPDGGTCQEPGYDYSIKYMNGWKYLKQSKDTLKFINFDEDANVVIQNILSASNGGKYNAPDEVLNDIKNQLQGMPSYNLISEGDHSVNNIPAKQFTASYMNGSIMWQEWYLCIPRQDGKMFYLFCYRANQKVYSRYLSSARIMLASFTPSGIQDTAQVKTPAANTSAPAQSKTIGGEDFNF